MADITLTKATYKELSEKLEYLKTKKRDEISLAIKTAKEFGDLSENAEYSAAKEEQLANEMEIARLDDTLSHATVLDEKQVDTKCVNIGTVVKLLDLEENEEITFHIVSSLEADSRVNKISNQSPIGKAIMGKSKGASVEVKTPAGVLKYKILDIGK